ncbi:MAG: TCR/Tet family MFS transporter [Rhizobiales bacterium]|nr:TCR/Tet family MFS transporter [Hyphomicrobiales bacterium]
MIFGILLVDTMGFGLLIPILPKLVEQMLGGDVAEASTVYGLLLASFALMGFIFSPIMGSLADRYGRRPVLFLSLAALTVDYLILAFAPSVGWLFLGRIIAGIFSATISVTSAYVADTSPPKERAARFGFTGAGMGLGLITGPMIGGLLGELGARAPFFAAAALALVNCVAAYLFLPESLDQAHRRPFRLRDANPLGAFLAVRPYPMVVVLLAVCFLMNLAGRMLESTWVLYTGYRFQWGAFEAGASLTAFGVAYAIAQVWLVRKLADKIGEWSTLLLGLVIGVGTFCIFAFAMGGWVMAVNVIPYGAATGIAGPALQALATKAMPVNRQGLLQGAIASLITATGVIGPPIGSYLFSFFIGEDAPTIFAGAPYIFAAALLAGALAVMLLWRNKLPHEGVMPEENSWPGPG